MRKDAVLNYKKFYQNLRQKPLYEKTYFLEVS